MSFKFHWGHGIMLFLLAFMIFILSFVYKTLFVKEYDHELVSKEYYNEEMAYQQEVDRLDNAKKLENPITINVLDNGITITFPQEFDGTKVSGWVKLLKVDDDKKDFQSDLKLSSNVMQVNNLSKGTYHAKVKWSYEGKDYQVNHKIQIK